MRVPCPTCHGRVYVNPFAQKSIGPCPMCDGRGAVDTDQMCRCGRPAVKSAADTLVCRDPKCEEKALKPPETTGGYAHHDWGRVYGGVD